MTSGGGCSTEDIFIKWPDLNAYFWLKGFQVQTLLQAKIRCHP